MIKIAIFNQKGGVAKTASTVNIAGCMERELKKKVLVMDCDAQQNSVLQLLGNRAENSIRMVLDGEVDLKDCIYPVQTTYGGKMIHTKIDVLGAGLDIDAKGPDDVNAYRNIASMLDDKYDYCLIDCPPQKMATAITALCACDYVLVPVWTETDESIQGFDMVLDLINTVKKNRLNETIEIIGMLVTRTRQTRALDKQLMNFYKEAFADILFDSVIRDAQDINDAYAFRKPVIYYKRTCNASKDYLTATNELVERIEKRNSEKKRKAGR